MVGTGPSLIAGVFLADYILLVADYAAKTVLDGWKSGNVHQPDQDGSSR